MGCDNYANENGNDDDDDDEDNDDLIPNDYVM